MKKLLFLTTFLIFACSDDDKNCFTILDKVISNGEFVFAGDSDLSNSDADDPRNGYADVNLVVSEEVFNSYNKGDDYCYE